MNKNPRLQLKHPFLMIPYCIIMDWKISSRIYLLAAVETSICHDSLLHHHGLEDSLPNLSLAEIANSQRRKAYAEMPIEEKTGLLAKRRLVYATKRKAAIERACSADVLSIHHGLEHSLSALPVEETANGKRRKAYAEIPIEVKNKLLGKRALAYATKRKTAIEISHSTTVLSTDHGLEASLSGSLVGNLYGGGFPGGEIQPLTFSEPLMMATIEPYSLRGDVLSRPVSYEQPCVLTQPSCSQPSSFVLL